jgi:hypothetical protein
VPSEKAGLTHRELRRGEPGTLPSRRERLWLNERGVLALERLGRASAPALGHTRTDLPSIVIAVLLISSSFVG